jgi:hypothetical protein
LEGREVPVVSAQVSTGIWAPSAAAIQIVPLDQGIDFKPRTMVHLFFLEDTEGPVEAIVEGGQELVSKELELDAAYKLMFVGEIVGFSFVKTPMSRAVILQCLDHSSYWDTLQATMMDWGPSGNALWNKGAVYASNTSIFANLPTQSQPEKLRQWINGKPQTPQFKNVGGLAGGILHMMEVMGGVRGVTLGVNDFFTIAELRNHLLAQVTAEDGDDTAKRMLNHIIFFDWLFGRLQNQDGQISLRDMFKLLCSYIYYAIVANPSPMFVEGGKPEATDDRLLTQIFRPDCFMAAPPTCNVIFPEQFTQVAYDRNFLTEVTRVEIGYYNHLAGQSALTSHYVLEPRIMDMAKNVAANINHKWRVLMDHERHTGIIAKLEWLPDSFGQFRGVNPEAAKQFKDATLTWQRRTGLFHFFKYRIGQRTVNLGARFIPYLVAGFPALVIQKPFMVEDTKGLDEDKLLDAVQKSTAPGDEWGAPPQFLGMIESVQHNIGQDGGSTQVSMSHCRNHLGIDDEFVGKALDGLRKSGSYEQLTRYRLAWGTGNSGVGNDQKRKDFLRDCTPQKTEVSVSTTTVLHTLQKKEMSYRSTSMDGGKPSQKTKTATVTTVAETTQPAPAGTATAETSNPNSTAGATARIPNPSGTKTVGSVGLHGGTIRFIEVEAPYGIHQDKKGSETTNYFNAIYVTEGHEIPVPLDHAIPVEYVVQPSWMSTSYDNENVGPKVYKKFFGCESIVDQLLTAGIEKPPPRIPEEGLIVSPEADEKAIKAQVQKDSKKRALLSIERAVNTLGLIYGRVRSEKKDVEAFIRGYTRRPIASKLDVLGSSDLEIDFEGMKPVVKKGKSGFHTMSVNAKCIQKGSLVGLLENPTMQLKHMNSKQEAAVKADYDVRKEKLEKVDAYIDALVRNGGRGFVG